MEFAFDAIGLEIANETAFNDLAEDAKKLGEASLSTRDGCVLHGRCWRLGLGLEVWTILYESKIGEVFYADCRPAFRANHAQNLSRWSLFETEADGEAAVEGYTEDSEVRVFFQLQNLTEIGTRNFSRKHLSVGLCGLAYRAEVSEADEDFCWKPLSESEPKSDAGKTDWRLGGQVLAFKSIRNPCSGKRLNWILLDLGEFKLEILVNRRTLRGSKLRVGAMIKADIWLQGHLVSQPAFQPGYEGVDWSFGTNDFWKKFKKLN